MRIGCEENLATGLLPALIDRLARRYPRLLFEMVIADPKTLRERDLHGRSVEVAIMRTATPDRDEALEAKILYFDRLWVVAGTKVPWARRRKIELADLINERWCLPPPDHPVGSLVIEAFRRSGLEPPQRSVTVASAQCTSNLLAKGQFLGVHGSMFLTSPSERPIESVASRTLNSHLVYQRCHTEDRTLSPVAQLFIDCAREVIKPLADKK